MDLRVKDVSFGYTKSLVIEGIDFEIVPGEVVGILGPNGSGKTTTLKVINRMLEPMTGTVYLGGSDTASWTRKQIAREVGMVPQNNQINFPFTVLDVVMMGRIPYSDRFRREGAEDISIVQESMELTGVSQFADRPITALSGGERQRVIIARALAQRPSVLLLDEPTNHLDVCHQLEILDLVCELSRERGMTVVFVSHDLGMVARYCDRVIMMRDSHIQASGPVGEVMTSENMRRVFDIEAELSYDARVGGHLVTVIGPANGNDN